ncbi:uncharacterized, partial [Tachysurus ichikawai]
SVHPETVIKFRRAVGRFTDARLAMALLWLYFKVQLSESQAGVSAVLLQDRSEGLLVSTERLRHTQLLKSSFVNLRIADVNTDTD